MTPEIEDELAKLGALAQGLTAAWPAFSKWLAAEKEKLTRELVEKDNEQSRGRIKQLNDILELPQRLQDEAITLRQPPQESEFP